MSVYLKSKQPFPPRKEIIALSLNKIKSFYIQDRGQGIKHVLSKYMYHWEINDSSGEFTDKCMTNDLDTNPSDNNFFQEPVQDDLERYTFLWPLSCSITESGKRYSFCFVHHQQAKKNMTWVIKIYSSNVNNSGPTHNN